MSKHYFGYGSLVNAGTRVPGERAQAAILNDWRRTWSHYYLAPWGPGRSLSVEESPNTKIAGALVELTDGALERLDERERGYDRLELDGALLDMPSGHRIESFYIYRTKSRPPENGVESHPILRSYMDVVMQGYRDVFGDHGLHELMSTTANWHGSIYQDRHAPNYVRATSLRSGEAELFDATLASKLADAP